MLPRLMQLTDSLDFEEDGFLRVHGAQAEERDLVVYLEVAGSTTSTLLRVRAHDVRYHHVVAPGGSKDVWLTDDHPILWSHSYPRSELYFRGKVDDVMSLVGALTVAHQSVAGSWSGDSGWLTQNERIRNPVLLAEVLESGSGLLSVGPVILLEAYAQVLDAYGVSHSMLEPSQPSWWNGEQWQRETERLLALMIGASYVIAPRYSEEVETGGLNKLMGWLSQRSGKR